MYNLLRCVLTFQVLVLVYFEGVTLYDWILQWRLYASYI